MGSVVWIAFGAVVAISCIVAAFVFRPDSTLPAHVDAPLAEPVAPVTEAVPIRSLTIADDTQIETATAAVNPPASATPPAPPPAVEPALADVMVVRLRVGPGFDAGRQAAIVAALTKAGVPSVKVEALPFKIATSRVGYYRAADLPAATELGKLIAPVLADGTQVGVRDYAQLLADPEPGRLDLWVGG